jgi:hypothetical protein
VLFDAISKLICFPSNIKLGAVITGVNNVASGVVLDSCVPPLFSAEVLI